MRSERFVVGTLLPRSERQVGCARRGRAATATVAVGRRTARQDQGQARAVGAATAGRRVGGRVEVRYRRARARSEVVGQRSVAAAGGGVGIGSWRTQSGQGAAVVRDGASVARDTVIGAAELAVAAERAQHRLAGHPTPQRAPAEPGR